MVDTLLYIAVDCGYCRCRLNHIYQTNRRGHNPHVINELGGGALRACYDSLVRVGVLADSVVAPYVL